VHSASGNKIGIEKCGWRARLSRNKKWAATAEWRFEGIDEEITGIVSMQVERIKNKIAANEKFSSLSARERAREREMDGWIGLDLRAFLCPVSWRELFPLPESHDTAFIKLTRVKIITSSIWRTRCRFDLMPSGSHLLAIFHVFSPLRFRPHGYKSRC